MVFIPYLFPFLACFVLIFGLHYKGGWNACFWILVVGVGFAALLQYLVKFLHTRTVEYLGSRVKEARHEESWTELQEGTETRRDSQGNFYTEKVIKEIFHPEKYYFISTRGTKIDIDSDFFDYILHKWQTRPTSVSWSGRHIKGGNRYGAEAMMPPDPIWDDADDEKWVCVTEKGYYVNKIQKSNSIFKFRKLRGKEAEAMGLYDYPDIVRHNAPCILSDNINIWVENRIREKFDRFNARFAPQAQMRLFILLFDASQGVATAEMQKTYWQGGNKNEFVICLGLTPSNEVKWASVFSWSDAQQLEAETANWFMRNPKLDWDRFYSWFLVNFKKWKRKEFSDFKYVQVSLQLWQIIAIYILCIIENIVAVNVALSP